MNSTSIELLYGQQARTELHDVQFIEHWRTLFSKCSYATIFQHPTFVCNWYEAYQPEWEPVVIRSWNLEGDLVGLWTLTYNQSTNTLAHAGTEQAEYHSWLAIPGEQRYFLSYAWSELKKNFKFTSVTFRYMPVWDMVNVLQATAGIQGCVIARKQNRPLLKLDPAHIKSTFSKKSNKSRFNRLNKLGKVEFRRLTKTSELEQVFEEIIVYYDFRQGAVNQSTPFWTDPNKRNFHEQLFASAPNETIVTVAYIDGKPISAFWGLETGKTVHLGMVMYSPFLAKYSPGKLHIMQLSEYLLNDGKQILDLTPGGKRSWKWRFANSSDEVAEVTAYRSRWSRLLNESLSGLIEIGKRFSRLAGIQPASVKSALRILRSQKLSSILKQVNEWLLSVQEIRIYEIDRSLHREASDFLAIHCNSLQDILLFDPGDNRQLRDAFLSEALERFENGESAYTVITENRLAFCGWLVTAPSMFDDTITFSSDTVVLCDFYSHVAMQTPEVYNEAIKFMLTQAFSCEEIRSACISIPAEDETLRRVAEAMGFHHRGSLLSKRYFGGKKKWSNMMIDNKNV